VRRTLLLAVISALLASHAVARPLVAVVADNAGTETSDFLVPFGMLSESGVADVVAVALHEGAVALHPALAVELDATLASFDEAHPAGADFVIVPALMTPADPALQRWLLAQVDHGATLVAICEGAAVLAEAGLLDGLPATSHWYALDRLAREHPRVRWTRDRRWVDAGRVVTTSGVSAAVPASLALIERIAGRAAARAEAQRVGMREWSPAHDGRAFSLDARAVWTAASNRLAFWRHERIGVAIADGVDEASLALAADALACTWRAEPVAIAPTPTVRTRSGLRIPTEARPVDRTMEIPSGDGPVLDHVLASIDRDYGPATADFAALLLEYPRAR